MKSSTAPTPLIISTGGSAGYAGKPAWAWVAETGEYRSGTCSGASHVIAALRSIAEALEAAPIRRSLVIRSESSAAVSLISAATDRRAVSHRFSADEVTIGAALVHRIVREARPRMVTFELVARGSRDSRDDAAQRLAYQARRCSQFGGDAVDLAELFDRIVGESLATVELV